MSNSSEPSYRAQRPVLDLGPIPERLAHRTARLSTVDQRPHLHRGHPRRGRTKPNVGPHVHGNCFNKGGFA